LKYMVVAGLAEKAALGGCDHRMAMDPDACRW
jgi:hypothetical protein